MSKPLAQFGKVPAGGRFRRWIIVISGFTQHLGRPNGSEKLFSALWPLASDDTCVLMRAWDDDWKALAEFMHRNTDHGNRPRVEVYAYSWGGGHGFPALARQLEKRGMTVTCAVLCDAVYRSRILPTWLPFNPLSMLSVPRITIPANVLRVDWFYQRQNRPHGHRLVAADPDGTTIHRGVELAYAHQWMDEAIEYHLKALEVAGVFQKDDSYV